VVVVWCYSSAHEQVLKVPLSLKAAVKAADGNAIGTFRPSSNAFDLDRGLFDKLL
jgi:hypothetical protein